MKKLLSLISLVFSAAFCVAQTNQWSFGLNAGFTDVQLNGLHSTYTPYFEGYGKIPYDLPGFGGNIEEHNGFPNYSKGSVPISVFVSRSLNQRFGLSFGYTGYIKLGGNTYNSGTYYLPSNITISESRYSNTTIHNIWLRPEFRFNKMEKKGAWKVYAVVGVNYTAFEDGIQFESKPETPIAFNGTAEEYFERSDWSFLWGGGLSYTYMFNANWGIMVAAELTTYMMRPQDIERTSYKINGQELLQTLPTRERIILLSDDLIDYPDRPWQAQVLPSENYRMFIPQVTLGVTYTL